MISEKLPISLKALSEEAFCQKPLKDSLRWKGKTNRVAEINCSHSIDENH